MFKYILANDSIAQPPSSDDAMIIRRLLIFVLESTFGFSFWGWSRATVRTT